MAFVTFLVNPVGRTLRMLVGVVIIGVGFVLQGAAGVVVSIIGLVPIATAALNLCLIGPLFGADIWGNPSPRHRARTH